MQSINQKTIGAIAHLAAFSKYFIPFGNFIIPTCIWVIHKEKPYVSANAKRSINFQISLFLYASILICIAITGLVIMGLQLGNLEDLFYSTDSSFKISSHSTHLNTPTTLLACIIITLGIFLFFLEIYGAIKAAIQAREGKIYKYPFTINFIKLNKEELKDLTEENTQPTI
ncbi:hypothetical protein SAMN04488096_102382 [Mesonia phycicola]|uniref:DUF4870 domain-containing protein n=1 Tax=Mesonia phycicola TaxID=579105 RepID=A0A1M6C5X3_9FLAO|nr:DUF4870 domain-containing protein [Mesonia phycicola]SHI56406.1 hypothetical protein SAMN04488096_102382 [Mesonia phycicola]